MYIQLTRLFPRIRVKLGSKPTEAEIIQAGFDIKITPEIRNKLAACQVGDYLALMTANNPESGELTGMNLKVKKQQAE